jgi:hypothetical protein
MSSSFHSTTIARLFAGVGAAAALAIAVPAFADPAAQPSGAVVTPAEKPAVPATGADAKTTAAPAKSSDATPAVAKEKTKIAANETGAVKHHHKVAKTEKPATEKTEAPATGTAGK